MCVCVFRVKLHHFPPARDGKVGYLIIMNDAKPIYIDKNHRKLPSFDPITNGHKDVNKFACQIVCLRSILICRKVVKGISLHTVGIQFKFNPMHLGIEEDTYIDGINIFLKLGR